MIVRNIETEILFETDQGRTLRADAVTVAVSLFNYEDFITETLDSIAASTHEHIDLIVVDDASHKDDSVGVTTAWMSENSHRFQRCMLHRHIRNQGLAEARNTAFGLARTEAVFVIDADNLVYPTALTRLERFVGPTKFAAAYSQLEIFGHERGLGQADIWNRNKLKHGNYIDAMAMISKSAWRLAGGYTHIEGGWEDYDFWCKLVELGLEGVYVPEILCRYRLHHSSMLRTETNLAEDRLRVALTLRHPWLEL